MSYKQIILSIRGYENRQLKDWERARLIAYYGYAGIPEKASKKSIFGFLPLSSDANRTNKRTKEQDKELRQFFVDKQKRKQNDN
jgi:hypothetical protein